VTQRFDPSFDPSSPCKSANSGYRQTRGKLSGKFKEGSGEGYADPHHRIWLTLLQALFEGPFNLKIAPGAALRQAL
jgi:hypothetical protein